MTYREAEGTRLRRQFSKQAIALAMQGRWSEAVSANKSLLENFPNDVDTYNRLGRAYIELGEYHWAKEAYAKAIELDPYNTIAKKNLERLSHLGETEVGTESGGHKVEPQQFIEEAGKTGVVNLYRPAPLSVLAKMVAGDNVNLRMEETNLVVENGQGEHLGEVGPKHGRRLIKLTEGGNKYSATIISVMEGVVKVMIREIYQHPSQAGRLSFPHKGTESLRSQVGDRIIRRGLEFEEALPGEASYTIIGGEETELLPEEPVDIDDEVESEE